ncbi:MAG TPA: endo alpha-1,4 polygalactosaminidase [Polyangiales bacterium]|nr:endo alpha-1,4 polygalactosaminidase [Polyangiales bacterium]
MLLSAALACGTTEGLLLRAADAGAAATSDPAVAEPGDVPVSEPPTVTTTSPDAGSARVASGMRLHYQITGAPAVDADADVFVLDLFDAQAIELATLHARGRIVMGYLSAGSLEPWRPDADNFPERAIGSELSGYPNESWLDIRDASVRALMRERLKLAREKGFDGVFPGALDAYRNQSGFALSERDQLDYDRFLASEARALGLSPGLSGDFMLSAQLSDHFDWAIAIGCIAAGSCERLQPFIQQAKPVFDLELEGELNTVCEKAKALGITLLMKRPSFDAWSRTCP